MSVTTSAATAAPTRLFGQHSPSPPAFTSPPQSPAHIDDSQTPELPRDVDMATSSTLPPLDGQNHDREEDALMHDSDTLSNGHTDTNTTTTDPSQPPIDGVAVQVAAVDDDAMDTSPDDSQGLVLPNGSADPREPTNNAQSSPTPNGENTEPQEQPTVEDVPPPPPLDHVTEQTNETQSINPPPPVDPNLPPPPPPEPPRSDSESSEDEDDHHPWHPIQEDLSTPDEAELKEIEASVEVSALDHDHWESRVFEPLPDSEHSPGVSGRIEWTVEHYNGTRDNPNKELVMKSDSVNIGGHEWQIKFYPRGNDSEYLSVYVECLSVQNKPSSKDAPDEQEHPKDEDTMLEQEHPKDEDTMLEQEHPKDEDTMLAEAATDTSPSEKVEPQHAPLPLLDGISVPKRRSVAAQVAVVLYNPSEPRVNYFKTCLHRFCSQSPDWGWTRFHGPYYDIAHRVRGQRQALLRDDKLAFTAYIRLVEDDTGCLWEHSSRDNPWDSFAMTGLQSLTLGAGRVGDRVPSGGNLISAIASWMLFKPFRELLHSYKLSRGEVDYSSRPKPLLTALQSVLFKLRTRVTPGSGPVSLHCVLKALEWYGIREALNKMDVIETWELLRRKLEDELRDTPDATKLEELFGRKKDYSSGIPKYRVPVVGVSRMQEAIDAAQNFIHPSQSLPQLLTIELQRQEFDLATRSYVKLLNKVSLDEQIKVRQTDYTLFGFVVHKQTLQSYVYHPVLRPEGPGSKWFTYTDGKEENVVKCLTKRQALENHEGKAGSGKVTGNDPIAYIALYVRADVAASIFRSNADPEPWEIRDWLRHEFSSNPRFEDSPPPTPLAGDTSPSSDERPNEARKALPELRTLHAIDSKAFLQHEGPGILDVYDPKWQPGRSELVYTIRVDDNASLKEVRSKLAAVVPGIQDVRQIHLWCLCAKDAFATPHDENPVSEDCTPVASLPAPHLWMHVVDFESLPKLPKKDQEVAEAAPSAPSTQAETSTSGSSADGGRTAPGASLDLLSDPVIPTATLDSQSPSTRGNEPHSEDTPMSEPDEPVPAEPVMESSEGQAAETGTGERPTAADPASREHADTTMGEVDAPPAPEPTSASDPSAIDVVVPATSTGPTDTEMAGAQTLPPPPPVFTASETQTVPEPPAPLQDMPMPEPPPPDMVYFFLKSFDAETQTLQSRGFHSALRSAKVDATVLSALNLPSDHKIDLFLETHEGCRTIRSRRSFQTNNLYDMTVLIASFPLTEEECNSLATRAAFSNLESFLEYRILARNFPDRLTGHFTYDYFSSEYYKGEKKNGRRHGHGTLIYHSGATYEGTFRLGLRHGHGLYTFENGDTYDGDWVNDQQHGVGTFVEAATGNTYVGGWKNDKKFGEGVTHWKNAQEPERLCRICYEENADAALYDCGHVVACLACARQVQNCPVCRKRVLSAMKLYYVA